LNYSNKPLNYRYQAFGLTFDSEFRLEDLIVLPEEGTAADVMICKGEFSELLDLQVETESEHYIRRIGADDIVIQAADASFRITKGRQILVQFYPPSRFDRFASVLLGAVMGVLLTQRGMLILHASAVAIDGRAVLFAGKSGSGKSTMAAAMQGRKHRLITDDICALVRDDNGIFWAQPSYPQQKISASSASILGIDAKNLRRVPDGRLKYEMTAEVDFQQNPLPVGAFYEIVTDPTDYFSVAPLHGAEKFVAVSKNASWVDFAGVFGVQSLLFQQCAEIAKSIPVNRIFRQENGIPLQTQAEQVAGNFALIRR